MFHCIPHNPHQNWGFFYIDMILYPELSAISSRMFVDLTWNWKCQGFTSDLETSCSLGDWFYCYNHDNRRFWIYVTLCHVNCVLNKSRTVTAFTLGTTANQVYLLLLDWNTESTEYEVLRFICDIRSYQMKYRIDLLRKALEWKISLGLKNCECNFRRETVWLRDMANYWYKYLDRSRER